MRHPTHHSPVIEGKCGKIVRKFYWEILPLNKRIFDEKLVWPIAADVENHFRLMGGAARYPGFAEWHPHALLLLLISGVDPTSENFLGSAESFLVSPRMWRETDGLPAKIWGRVAGGVCSPRAFEVYLQRVSKHVVATSGAREIISWSRFLVDNTDRFDRFLD